MSSLAIEPFETTFAVPLHCESCVRSVSGALTNLPGVHSISADLASQILHITGTASPSAIVSAIQSTGRDAILRGTGKSNKAAVCILERYSPSLPDGGNKVRGLARIVQVSDKQPPRTVVDLALRGLESGTYHISVRSTGDVRRGAASTGPIWDGLESAFRPKDARPKGYLGQVEVGKDGRGSVFLDREVDVTDFIGRGLVVSKEMPEASFKSLPENDEATVVGVIARSAGAWENDKTVCSCSGKNVWEEREEQSGRGMM